MVFKMTAFDVAVGRVRTIKDCPIGLAISRKLKGPVIIWCEACRLSLNESDSVLNKPRRVTIQLPPNVIEFIRMTDLGLMPAPITFVLDIPDSL